MKQYIQPQTQTIVTVSVSAICGQSAYTNLTDLKGGGDGSWSHAQ